MNGIDDLTIALMVLIGIRFLAVVVFCELFLRRRERQHAVLAIAWLAYLAAPLCGLLRYLTAGGIAHPLFGYFAAVGTLLIVAGTVLYYRAVSPLRLFAGISLFMTALGILVWSYPSVSGTLAVLSQMMFFLILCVIVFFKRRWFMQSGGGSSYYWLLAMTLAALFHSVGFQFFYAESPLSIRFFFTGLVNIVFLIFFLHFEYNQSLLRLGRSEQQYRLLTEHIADVVWIFEPETMTFSYISPSVEGLLGYSAAEALTLPLERIVPPFAQNRLFAKFAERVQQFHSEASESMTHRDEIELRCRDASLIWTEMSTRFVRNERGPLEIVGVSRDISERKQAEASVMYERSLLYTLMDKSLDHIYFKDRAHRFIRVNKAVISWLKVENAEQALGKTDFDFFRADHARQAYEDEEHVMQSGQSLVIQEKETWPDDRLTWVSTVKSPLVDERGVIIGTFGISRDITEQVRAKEELKRYSEGLQEMVDERSRELEQAQKELLQKERLAVIGRLAGSVAHELRHPLGVLSNAAYFLNMSLTEADDTTKEYLAMMAAEVQKSDKIISDLLDFSHHQIREKSAKVTTTFAGLLDRILLAQPPPEGVEIIREMAPALPALRLDPQQIEHMFANLLLNACQAMTEGGRVTIRAVQDRENIRISVTDTGCGIPPEHLEKVFEPLFSTRQKGIGLGLPMCKNLAEANGGWIAVESEEGQGSTFTVSLPVERNA